MLNTFLRCSSDSEENIFALIMIFLQAVVVARRILCLIFLIGFVGSSSDSEEKNISVILLLLSLLLLVLLSVVGYPSIAAAVALF